MKIDCGNGDVIKVCSSGGKIQFKDERSGQIFIRSGKWLRDKLREEGGDEE